jgi:hypothetical protein
MSDNPYRFTVKVEYDGFDGMWWVNIDRDGTPVDSDIGPFSTEAEANEHAELIRQAMREVS